MILEKGRISEFDSPKKLIQDPRSALHKMLKDDHHPQQFIDSKQ